MTLERMKQLWRSLFQSTPSYVGAHGVALTELTGNTGCVELNSDKKTVRAFHAGNVSIPAGSKIILVGYDAGQAAYLAAFLF